MKPRDIVYLIISGTIFVFVGYIGFTQLAPQNNSSTQTTVEVVDPIASQFDGESLTTISDATKIRDFAVLIDLTGLGNQTPFGQH
jgi:hypothetical protein